MTEFTFPENGGMIATNWGVMLLIASHLVAFLLGISIAVVLLA